MNDRAVRSSDSSSITDWVFGSLTDDNGVIQTITSFTVQLSANGVQLPNDGTNTVRSDGRAAYEWGPQDISFLNANAADPFLDCLGVWIFLVNGNSIEKTSYVDIINVDIGNGVTSRQLVLSCSILKSGSDRFAGTVESGSTTLLVDSSLLRHREPNDLAGGQLHITSGPNAGHIRQISNSDPISGTVTVTQAFPHPLVNSNGYEITAVWAWQIREAYMIIQNMVNSWVGRESGASVASDQDINYAHLYLSIHLALLSFDALTDHMALAKEYKRMSDSALLTAKIRYTSGDRKGDEAPGRAWHGP